MKIVIIKDEHRPSGKVWKPGTNALVNISYGNKLVASGKALEVPEPKGDVWLLQGKPSNYLMELRKFYEFPVTLKELEKHPKFKKTQSK